MPVVILYFHAEFGKCSSLHTFLHMYTFGTGSLCPTSSIFVQEIPAVYPSGFSWGEGLRLQWDLSSSRVEYKSPGVHTVPPPPTPEQTQHMLLQNLSNWWNPKIAMVPLHICQNAAISTMQISVHGNVYKYMHCADYSNWKTFKSHCPERSN